MIAMWVPVYDTMTPTSLDFNTTKNAYRLRLATYMSILVNLPIHTQYQTLAYMLLAEIILETKPLYEFYRVDSAD